MIKKLFPLFITLFGLFTAYIFYAFWHSEEINPSKIKVEKKTIKDISLENKKIISKTTTTTPTIIKSIKHKIFPVPKNFQSEIMIEEQSEDIYDELRPDTQQEFIEEAKEAFEMFDTQVIEMDAKILDEEQDIQEGIEEDTTDEEY